jgi:hypothetical protein
MLVVLSLRPPAQNLGFLDARAAEAHMTIAKLQMVLNETDNAARHGGQAMAMISRSYGSMEHPIVDSAIEVLKNVL